MMNQISAALLTLALSTVAFALDPKGTYSAEAELSQGQQVYAVSLTLEESHYTLMKDLNHCDFQRYGSPSCTEIAPQVTSGQLILKTSSQGLRVFTLSGSPGVELVIQGTEKISALRILELDAAGHVTTSRRLRELKRQ